MVRKTPSKMKFTGELAKPIVRRSLRDLKGMEAMAKSLGLSSDDVHLREAQRIDRERSAKFELLAKKFGIPDDTPRDSVEFWETMAKALAEAFVRGFQIVEGVQRGRGRARTRAELLEDIAPLIQSLGSVSAACNHLVKQRGRWKGRPPATLETLFYEARKELESQCRQLESDLEQMSFPAPVAAIWRSRLEDLQLLLRSLSTGAKTVSSVTSGASGFGECEPNAAGDHNKSQA